MTDMFSPPASTQGISWQDSKGALLLISPLSIETGVSTVHGPTDAIRADIVNLDTGETFTDVLVFPKVLQGQLRSKLGGKVLGRLGQGVAKPGQSAPWTLVDFTPDDAKKAQDYLAKSAVSGIAAADSPPF
jgi:hypothetical protein